MARMQASTRPLKESEKRLLTWAISHRKRRLRKSLRRTSIWSAIVFGALWAFSILAAYLDKRGPSWYVSGLIWLGIGIPMTLWSYAGARSDVAKVIGRFESARRENNAYTFRIETEQYVDFEEEEDEGACYAFQLDRGRIVFVSGQEFFSSPHFPNNDFCLVEIRTQDGLAIIGHIERRGHKVEPTRTIQAKEEGGA